MTFPAHVLRLAAMAALSVPTVAHAALPDPVRAMIDAAIATGDAEKVKTVTELAKQTNPDDIAEIDQIQKAFLDHQAVLAAQERARKEEEIRTAGLFDNWSGKGQIGASQSSGNTSSLGFNAALSLERKGLAWSHKLRGTADYQRNNGNTSREQYLLSYEPRFVIQKSLFAFGLAQFESDRFQGYSARYSISGGVGYQVIDTPSMDLAIKAGPAFRRTDYTSGDTTNSVGGLAGLDFDWRISKVLTLTQDTNLVAESGSSALLIVDSGNTSLALTTGLEAKIAEGLSTRISYAVEYDSNPPPGAVSTDTTTRFTLVYGF